MCVSFVLVLWKALFSCTFDIVNTVRGIWPTLPTMMNFFCEDSVWIYSKLTMEILEQYVKSMKGNNKNAAAL